MLIPEIDGAKNKTSWNYKRFYIFFVLIEAKHEPLIHLPITVP